MALIAENFITSPHCYSEAIEKLRAKLVTLASSIAPRTGVYKTSIDGFKTARSICTTEITPSFYKPRALFFIQGAKTIKINKSTYARNSPSCLVVSASLRALSRIVSAYSVAPYISLCIDLDINEIFSICNAWPKQNQLYQVPCSAIGFEDVNDKMYDTLFCLTCTLENPRDMKALAPLLLREITFRLLQSSHGFQLREIARHNSQLRRINHAMTSLVNYYNAPSTRNIWPT
ncbi:AraC family transcriptional regulator [Pseudomonas syringae]|uniref:AraC family transcriptional regulator n=1 Tax=Pseudomonas syringae TaxID=317 RepID=UPI0009B1A2CD